MNRSYDATSLIPLFALLAAGCGTNIRYTPTNSPPHSLAARPADSVEVYASSRPERGFIEVGLIEARQESNVGDNSTAVLTKLRAAAGDRGCDAIILSESNSQTRGTTLLGYRATCIAYK